MLHAKLTLTITSKPQTGDGRVLEPVETESYIAFDVSTMQFPERSKELAQDFFEGILKDIIESGFVNHAETRIAAVASFEKQKAVEAKQKAIAEPKK